MKVFFDAVLPEALKGGTWLIGKFDGVHQGHRAVIAQVEKPRLLTFDPYPAEFFAPSKAPKRLTDMAQKQALLAEAGVEIMVVKRFDAAFAALSPAAFIEQILLKELGAEGVAVGAEFHFGQGRTGDVALLEAYLPVQIIAPVVDAMGERISSSRIRAAVENGERDLAEKLLGRPSP